MTGAETKDVVGEMPCSSAAARANGLNDGAGLTLALDGEVELALGEVATAVHREHATVARVDGHERRRRAVVLGQPLRDRLARESLETEVDGRADAHAAAEDPRGAERVDELLLHVVREVRSRPLDAGEADVGRARAAARGRRASTRPA